MYCPPFGGIGYDSFVAPKTVRAYIPEKNFWKEELEGDI